MAVMWSVWTGSLLYKLPKQCVYGLHLPHLFTHPHQCNPMAPPKPSFLLFAPGSAPSIDQDSGPITKRQIDRSVLVNIAPDREDLLLSDNSIDELRYRLRVRSASPQA